MAYIPYDSGLWMTDQAKTENSGVGQIAAKIILPALAAALVLGAYFYLLERSMNLPAKKWVEGLKEWMQDHTGE